MKSKWVPLLRAGKYPQATLTREFLGEIERNTNRVITSGAYQPALKLAHGDNGDAQGFVTATQLSGDVLFGQFDDVSDELREKMRTKRRRYLSGEIDPEFSMTGAEGDEVGPVLTGVAILGAKMPQMRGLVDLSQYEFQNEEARERVASAGILSDVVEQAERRQFYFAELDDELQIFEEATMTPEEQKEMEELRKANKELQEKAQSAFDAEHTANREFATRMTKDGRITAGEKEGLIETLDSLSQVRATDARSKVMQQYEARQPAAAPGQQNLGGDAAPEKGTVLSKADFEAAFPADSERRPDSKAIARIDAAVQAKVRETGKAYPACFAEVKESISF